MDKRAVTSQKAASAGSNVVAAPRDVLGRVKLRHLRVLVAIEDHRSLRGAAELLHVSEPAISNSLRELESILGCRAFERRGRLLRPTPQGSVLMRHARAMLAELRSAGDALATLESGGSDRLAIGTLLTAESDLVPRAVTSLRAQVPDLQLMIRCGELTTLLTELRTGALDIVVGRIERTEVPEQSEFREEVLFRDPMVIVAAPGHALARKGRVAREALAEATWVLPLAATWRRDRIDEALRALDIGAPRHVECESLFTALELVRQANVLGVLPERFARPLAQQGRLAIVPVALHSAFGPVGAIWRSAGLSEVAERFLGLLRDAVRYDSAEARG